MSRAVYGAVVVCLLLSLVLCYEESYPYKGQSKEQRREHRSALTEERQREQQSDSDWNIRFHLSTKSPYTVLQNSSTYTAPPEGSCKPVLLNLLARHGCRYPGKSDIQSFATLAQTMNSYAQYYSSEYQWMASWTNPYKTQNADVLTFSGQLEHYDLANRLQEALDPLLSSRYYPYLYEMQSTQVSRTGQSGVSFGYSMEEYNGFLPDYPSPGFMPFYIYSDSLNEDVQLRFFSNCPYYADTVDDNPDAQIQTDEYSYSHFPAVAEAIARKIGVYPYWNISNDQLNLMYKGCGYDLSIYNITDHFCTLFDAEDTFVLEYAADLQNYYQCSYGYSINYEIACLLMQDIFSVFDGYVNGTSTVEAKLRFAHAETVIPFVSLLGLFNDGSPLLANWTDQEIYNRQFRSSYISPFGANVQMILYDCDGDYYVRTLVNEQEQILPNCNGEVYCPYAMLKDNYQGALTCDYSELCFPDSQPCDLCDNDITRRVSSVYASKHQREAETCESRLH